MRICAFAIAVAAIALGSACSYDVPSVTLDMCQRPGLVRDAIFTAQSELGQDWQTNVKEAYDREFKYRNLSHYRAAAVSHYYAVRAAGANFPKGTSWRCHLLISAKNYDAVGDVAMHNYNYPETAELVFNIADRYRKIVRSYPWYLVEEELSWRPPDETDRAETRNLTQ